MSRLPPLISLTRDASDRLLVRLGLREGGEAVAYSPFGVDVTWLAGIIFQFLSQIADVDRKHAVVGCIFGAPDVSESLLMLDDASLVFDQITQQPKLGS